MSKVDQKPKSNVRPGAITVKLDYPFEYETGDGKEMISEVVLNRPKGKHLKSITKDLSLSVLFGIAAKVAAANYITPSFFDEMDAQDCMSITEVIGDFLEPGQKTGETI